MSVHPLTVLRSFRDLVEAGPASELPVPDARADVPTRKCPPGFRFNGKSCVPVKKPDDTARSTKPGSSKGSALPSGPPPSRREDNEGDFPHTREHSQSAQAQDIPLVPDPDHEVMQRPHNAIAYANGQRPHEYADEEWKEYAQNAYTQVKFPDAFDDKNSFVIAFLNGEQTETVDWSFIQNASATSQKEADYPSLFHKFWEFKGEDWSTRAQGDEASAKDEFKDYLDELVEKAYAEETETTPPAILGLHKDPTTGKETSWLISGNSRALMYAFLGRPVPTRVVPLKGRCLPDPTDEELKTALWPAEQSSDDDETVEQNVRAAVQQVIDARGAPESDGAASPDAAQAGPAPAAPPPSPGPPAPDQAEAVFRAMRGIFESDSPMSKRYQSGHTKRLFRRMYKSLGYPVGTVRKWVKGRVVKTAHGWEELPEGPAAPAMTARPVPAASHDAPVPVKSPAAADVSKTSSEDGHWIPHVPGFPKETTHQHYAGWKAPKPYRQKLHDAVLGKYFDKVPTPSAEDLKTKKPVAIMLMGGPASGKTTIGNAYPDDQFVHLDADGLKEHIPEYRAALKWRAKNAAKMAHEESIHMMQQLREKTIAAKKNLVMDGTGRHLDSYLNMISKLKTAGYYVKVVMADVDQKTAEHRSKVRGRANGRWVPPEIFDSAYSAVPRNFAPISKAADDFEVWDTRKEDAPSLKWERTDGKEQQHDPDFVKQFKQRHESSRPFSKPFTNQSSSGKDPMRALRLVFKSHKEAK